MISKLEALNALQNAQESPRYAAVGPNAEYDSEEERRRKAQEELYNAQKQFNKEGRDLYHYHADPALDALHNPSQEYRDMVNARTRYEQIQNEIQNPPKMNVADELQYASNVVGGLSPEAQEGLKNLAQLQQDAYSVPYWTSGNIDNVTNYDEMMRKAKLGQDLKAAREEFKKSNNLTDEQLDGLLDFQTRLNNKERNDLLNSQAREAVSTGSRASQIGNAAALTGLSILTSPFRGIAALTENEAQKRLGRSSLGTDIYAPGYDMQNMANAARGAVGERIENSRLGSAGRTVYEAGLSSAESLYRGAIAAGTGIAPEISTGSKALNFVANKGLGALEMLPTIGADAYAGAYQNARQRGLSDENAQATAIASGLIEVGTEVFSLDNLFDVAKGGSRLLRKPLMAFISQNLIEGSEEFASEGLNAFADWMINKGESEYNQTVNAYMAEGMSEQDAKRKATADVLKDAVVAFGGGALAGAMGGAGATAVGIYNTNRQARQMFDQNTDYAELAESIDTDEANYKNKSAADSAQHAKDLAERLNQKKANGEKISNRELRDLYWSMMDAVKTESEARQDNNTAAAAEQNPAETAQDLTDNVQAAPETATNAPENAQIAPETAQPVADQTENASVGQNTNESTPQVTAEDIKVPEKYKVSRADRQATYKRISSAQTIDEMAAALQEVQETGDQEAIREAQSYFDVFSGRMAKELNLTDAQINDAKERPQTRTSAYVAGYKGLQVAGLSPELQEAYNEGKIAAAEGPKAQASEKRMLKNYAQNYATVGERKAFLETYKPGSIVERHRIAFDTAYGAGRQVPITRKGISPEEAYEQGWNKLTKDHPEYVRLLGEDTVRNMYDAGIQQSMEDAQTEVIRNARAKLNRKGTGKFSDFRANPTQDVESRLIDAFASASGLDMELREDLPKGVNGFYDVENSKLVLNAKSGKVMTTLGHEFFEFANRFNSEEFKPIIQDTMTALRGMLGETEYQNLRSSYIDRYEFEFNSKEGKTLQDLDKEMAADVFMDIIADDNGLENLLNVIDQNHTKDEARTIKQRIADFISEIIDKFRDLLSGERLSDVQRKALDTRLGDMYDLRQRVIDAVQKAVKNYHEAKIDGFTVETNASPMVASIDVRNSLDYAAMPSEETITMKALPFDASVLFTGTDEEIEQYEKAEREAEDKWKGIVEDPSFVALQVNLGRGRVKILSPSVRGGLFQLTNVQDGEPTSHSLYGAGEGHSGDDYWHPMEDLYRELFLMHANKDKKVDVLRASLDKVPTRKRFSMDDKIEQTKDLIAVHNLTADQLLADIELGGLPSPSIAIIRAGMEHSKYGDVSLIFGKESIDPKATKKNKVYSGDAWTPTFPTVEYKLNSKKVSSIESRINELVPYEYKSALGNISLDETNMSQKINSFSGDAVNAYADNDVLKYAFLKDKGVDVKVQTRERALSSKLDNSMVVELAKLYSPEEFEDMRSNLSSVMREKPDVVEAIRTKANELYRQKYAQFKDAEKPFLRRLYEKDHFEELYFSDLDNLVRAVTDYNEYGIQTEPDPAKMRDAVQDQTNQEEFEKWLADLFDGVIEKKGIRNSKELFTSSGNRRSWDQLHDDMTLENIVKAMNAEESKGANSFFAQSAIQAIATKDFSSIEDIRKSKGQLRMVSDEEHKALQDEHANRFREIAEHLVSRSQENEFMAFDSAASSIADAMKQSKTAAGIEKILKNWYGNKAYDGIGQDIIDLRDSIASMPTGYFEAKPRRAVYMNEIQYAVVPDNVTDEFRDRLNESGIVAVPYEAGNEEARVNAINSLEGIGFSVESDVAGRELSQELKQIPERARFSMSAPVEKTKKFIAVHNLSEENLDKSLDLGGFPMPSIAIIKEGMRHKGFGEVTLIFNRSAIDPEININNRVYGADAYTPTFPQIDHTVNRDLVYRIKDELTNKASGIAKGVFADDVYDAFDSLGLYTDGWTEIDETDILNTLSRNYGVRAAYLKDTNPNAKIEFQMEIIHDDDEIDPEPDRIVYPEDEVKNQIDSLINNKDLKNWIKHEIQGILGEPGIYNEERASAKKAEIKANQDGFDFGTPWLGANDANFEDIHDKYTMNNLVNAMKRQGERAVLGFPFTKFMRLAAKSYNSIDEMHKDSERLRTVSKEYYNSLERKFEKRYDDIVYKVVHDRNSDIELNAAANVLEKIVRNNATEDSMKRWLKDENLVVSDGIAKEINQLINDIANAPAKYFEAKPQGVVYDSQIAIVIAPEDMDQSIFDKLDDKGIYYITYEKGNEKQRRELMHSFPHVRFSVESNTDTKGRNLSTQQQEYFADSKVRDENGNLKVMYHGTPQGGFTVFKNDLAFFTEDKDYANRYQSASASSRNSRKTSSNPQTYEVYLNMKNPFDIRDAAIRRQFINEYVKGGYALGINPYTEYKDATESGLPSWEEADNIYEWMEENDLLDTYDGILVDEGGVPDDNGGVLHRGIAYITFNSNQIKNVDNQNPTDNPDIRMSVNGEENGFDFGGDNNKVRNEGAKILELGAEALKNQEVDRKTVRKIASDLRAKYGSRYNLTSFTDNLERVFAYAQSGEYVNYRDLMKVLEEVARPVIEEAGELVGQERYDEFMGAMKGYTIALTPNQKMEVISTFGSYQNFRNAMGGIRIANNGTSLDSIWDEICDRVPGLERDTVEGDQPEALYDMLQAMKPTVKNGYGMDMEEAARDLSLQIVEKYYEEAGKKNSKVAAAAEQMKKQNEEYRKDLKETYLKRFSEAKQAMGAHYDKETAQLRARLKKRAQDAKARREQSEQVRIIRKEAGELLNWAANPSKEHHVMNSMLEPVMDLLSAMDFATPKIERTSIGFQTRVWDPALHRFQTIDGNTYTEVQEKVIQAIQQGSGSAAQRRWSDKMAAIQDIYAKVQKGEAFDHRDMDDLVRTISPALGEELKDVLDRNRDVVQLSDLEVEDLKVIKDVIRNVKHAVEYANKAFTENVDLINTAQKTIRNGLDAKNSRAERSRMGNRIVDFTMLDMATPETYFDLAGTPEVYQILRQQGLNKKIHNVRQISEAMEDIMKGVKPEDVKKWRGTEETIHTFKLLEGTIKMSDAQIMSLYELNKRQQAKLHQPGGITIDTLEIGKGLKKIQHKQSKAVHLSEADIKHITSTLTPEQIRIADAMQQYMANECAKMGNDATMKMWGYELFTDPNYFPIRVDDNSISMQSRADVGVTNAIANMGFTKRVNSKARNAVVVQDIFSVFAKHTADMATYNAYAPAIADALRWYNYKETTSSNNVDITYSVQNALQKMLGDKGKQYFEQLITDLNEKERSSYIVTPFEGLISNYKVAAIAANARVVIQQPTAIVRASNVIDPKYLTKGLSALGNLKGAAERMKESSDIAWWKSQGYYESDIGPSMERLITGQSTVKETLQDKALAAAGAADDITWSVIYRAVELETQDKYKEKGKSIDSEAYKEEVSRRFDDVIDQTQVVDATLLRSQYMRSKDALNKLNASFMAEPTKSYNMLMKAWVNAARHAQGSGARKYVNVAVSKAFLKAAATFVATGAVNAAAQAVLDALRGAGKEDDKYGARYINAYVDNIKENVNPLLLLPWVKDAADILISGVEGIISGEGSYSGSTTGRMDLDALSSFMTAIQGTVKYAKGQGKKTLYGVINTDVRALSQLTGIPAYNLMRDMTAIYNQTRENFTGLPDLFETSTDNVKKKAKSGVYTAIDAGGDYKAAIKSATDKGVSLDTIEKNITTQYKPQYLELLKSSPAEAAKLENRLMIVYEYIDKQQGQKSKTDRNKVKNWAK